MEMATTATSLWGPSSYQIRFAFKCVKSHTILVRTHRLRKLDRQIHILSVTRNRNLNELGKGRHDRSQLSLNSVADGFSGWSGSDDTEESGEPVSKGFSKGLMGAGVAGVILVTALTFAALALSKHNHSKTRQQMEPLTTQQEESLNSDTENDNFEHEGKEANVMLEDNSTVEINEGKDNDSFSSPEVHETSTENNYGNDIDNETSLMDTHNQTPNSTEPNNNDQVQGNLQDESAFDDSLVDSDTNPNPPKFSESEIVDASSDLLDFKDTHTPEISVVDDDSIDVEPTNPFDSNSNIIDLNTDYKEELSSNYIFNSSAHKSNEIEDLKVEVGSKVDEIGDSTSHYEDDNESLASTSIKQDLDDSESLLPVSKPVSSLADPSVNEKDVNGHYDMNNSNSILESLIYGRLFSSVGIPAPSAVSAALQVLPGKVLIPAVVDQVQSQALDALKVLKVIEADVQPSDLCTRRQYARWLVTASSALSRSTSSKVYPAMYIEKVTELAFDDITPDDPDFCSIQGLAEAGLISSKLSRHDLLPLEVNKSPLFFFPDSPLSRQDLVCWKMALEKKQLPEADKKIMYQLTGFIDIDKINPDAWPALVSDMSMGEQGIIALAFGYTRLFQPEKPVTTVQAAIALSTGEASDMVSEELARIEAETMAENAVNAHNALIAQVESEINASFEKELFLEREKINAVEKLAEEAKMELEKLRAQREEESIGLMKERAAVESEMEVLSRLRGEVEAQLETLMSNKVETSFEKERISKIRKEVEIENQEISRLQYELEVERKALSMARSWAEDEAKRAREQAKFLEEARNRWEKHGIKVVVDSELREDATAGVTWLSASEQITSVEETVTRGETFEDKLQIMANDVKGKSREIINIIIEKIHTLISKLKEWISKVGENTGELKNAVFIKAKESTHEMKQSIVESKDAVISKTRESAQELQRKTSEITSSFTQGAKRVAGDCKDGVEKLTQKFKI